MNLVPSTSFFAMGSKISIEVSENSPAIHAAPGWFRGWEAVFSRFKPDSELSCLNARRGAEISVSPPLWALLRAALSGARQTGGLVSPTLQSELEAAGYDRSFEQVNGQARPAAFASANLGLDGWKSVRLNTKERAVFLPNGIRLDLGGYAKGWAADQAVRRLGKHAPALVNAGGDIAVSGPREGDRPWLVGISRPEEDAQHVAVLPLLRGGVATSGRNYRHWSQGGISRHHIIDPRTGQPAETDVLTVTVVAPSALEAEIAAKAVLILGSAAGLAWLRRRSHLAGILVLEDHSVLCSPGLSKYLK